MPVAQGVRPPDETPAEANFVDDLPLEQMRKVPVGQGSRRQRSPGERGDDADGHVRPIMKGPLVERRDQQEQEPEGNDPKTHDRVRGRIGLREVR